MGKSLQDWKVEIERAEGRSLSKSENDYLDCLTDLLDTLDWKETLHVKDIALLDDKILAVEKDPRAVLGSNLWVEPPEDEYSLWQYVALILADREIALPEFLQSQANLAATRKEIHDREQTKEARLWRNRLGNLSQRREFSQQGSLEARLMLQGRALKWETRQAGFHDFAPLPAKELNQWLAKDFGFLDRFHANSLPLCALFQEYYRSTQRVRLDLDKTEDGAFLNLLIHRPDTREWIVNKEGAPLSISDRRLKWTGSESGPNDEGNYTFTLIFEDDLPAPVPLLYLPGARPLYLHADTLYRGPSLLKPDADPKRPFAIPEDAVESPEGLLFLKNQGMPFPERLKGKVVTVPLQPRLYCRITTIGKAPFVERALTVSVATTSRDEKRWFILSEEGWAPSDNLETGEPSVPPEEGSVFEHLDANMYQLLLQEFELSEIDQGVWQRPIENDFPEAFTQWLQNLPSELQVIADDELDTLVDGAPAGRYALKVSESPDQDWFDIRLEPELLDTSLSENEQRLLLQAEGRFVHFPGKGWKRFDPSVAPDQGKLLRELGLSDSEAASDTHSFHAIQLAESKLEEAAMQQLARDIRKRAKEISTESPANLPKGINTPLRPYQEEGFKFLAFLSRNRFGGILADDMGLGKTLQTLAWLTWLKLHHPDDKPFQCLVVCPKSVMHVWKREVELRAEKLSLATFDPALIHPVAWQAAGIDILVANYSQLRINHKFFLQQEWTAAILDEGQYIKNPQSQTAKVACSLKSKHRLVLTGTPIENRTLDLWSLFSFAMPGLLGTQRSFKLQYKETDPDSPNRLFKRVRHFMLRRSKSQVAPDLPDRIEETLTCELEGDQKDLYSAELKNAQQQLSSIDSEAEFDRQRFNILSSLLRLRQICCHPRLIDPAYADMKSSKIEALVDHVSELMEEGHKVLIFSQFVEMLEIIRGELEAIGCKHLMLTGKTQNREELIEQFQEDSSITAFLLSLRAAGSGLNLTAASYVILYDPWWNPAVEAQAIDRTHRIGQQNAVNAYRLIAANTIEDKIQGLQLQKEALANEVVREESLNQILNLERLKAILQE